MVLVEIHTKLFSSDNGENPYQEYLVLRDIYALGSKMTPE